LYVLDSVWKQREYDGKHMFMIKVFDHENTYRYQDENGKPVKFIPTMWIVKNVYDYELEITTGDKK
jgi:hypothetical protein